MDITEDSSFPLSRDFCHSNINYVFSLCSLLFRFKLPFQQGDAKERNRPHSDYDSSQWSAVEVTRSASSRSLIYILTLLNKDLIK